MKIHITVVAYALADPLIELVTQLSGPDTFFHIFQHSQRRDVVDALKYLERFACQIYPYGTNRGLARSWNEGLIESQKHGADVLMIANDDVVADRFDLLELAQTAKHRRDYGVIQGFGLDQRMNKKQPMAFALCAINPVAIDMVGYFDENFFPIFFEDTDWCRRCALANVKWLTVPTNIVHAGTSTMHSVPELLDQNNTTFPANHLYYAEKWGGPAGEEKYTLPFNDPNFDFKISAQMRDAPYPGYNREDQEIVKL